MHHITVYLIIIFCSLQASSCLSSKRQPKETSLASAISAIKQGKPEKVPIYVRNNPAILNSSDENGCTLLHWAAYCDTTGVSTENLLDSGAPIDAKDKDGRTAFDWAYEGANASAMQQLIKKAIALGRLTLRGQDGKTLLHYAAALDHKESNALVKRLLALGLDPNLQDNYGRNPLCYAQRNDILTLLYSVTH
ncbi:ankyrin repeat domain-containing protein [Cardinium endosymbiont of Philonthus spinipes]|uniref:ankyrin repeat domain-containing protein n=1 Tax=Cardinium endosymbiont of Philonthus spinipes TaxID=3077941 RepID=UPI00313DA5B4